METNLTKILVRMILRWIDERYETDDLYDPSEAYVKDINNMTVSDVMELISRLTLELDGADHYHFELCEARAWAIRHNTIRDGYFVYSGKIMNDDDIAITEQDNEMLSSWIGKLKLLNIK